MIESLILVNHTDPDTGVGTLSLNEEIETLLLNEVPIKITPVIYDDGEGIRRVVQGIIEPVV